MDLGWESTTCPRRYVTPQSWFLINLHSFYRDGHLPVAGGISSQPAKILQAFSIIAERRAYNEKRRTKGGKKTPR